jgi:hypothetical protein
MNSTDPYIMLFVQMAIVLFAILAVFRDYQIRKKEQNAEATAEAIRGEKSMATLYTVYGATIASCLVLIDIASGLDGHKVALIVLDFLCVTYVFFFSTWFRNSVFFPLLHRVRKD